MTKDPNELGAIIVIGLASWKLWEIIHLAYMWSNK